MKSTTNIYTCGIFDLFHISHLKALKQAKSYGTHLVVGVCTDSDAQAYKRQPIIPYEHRFEIIRSLSFVDKVVCGPLVTPRSFYEKHQITWHIQAEDEYDDTEWKFYNAGKEMGLMKFIGRDKTISTTEIITSIKRAFTNE